MQTKVCGAASSHQTFRGLVALEGLTPGEKLINMSKELAGPSRQVGVGGRGEEILFTETRKVWLLCQPSRCRGLGSQLSPHRASPTETSVPLGGWYFVSSPETKSCLKNVRGPNAESRNPTTAGWNHPQKVITSSNSCSS